MLFRLCFSLFTSTISQKLLYFILLYLLMINLHKSNSCFNVLQTTVNLATQLLHREQIWESWIPLAQHQLFLIRLLPVCKCKYQLNTHGKSVTNVMEFGFENCVGTLFKVIINNHSISPEDKLKYLGVLLDNKLSWKPHVQKVKTQLSRACGVLTKLKHYTTVCTESCL